MQQAGWGENGSHLTLLTAVAVINAHVGSHAAAFLSLHSSQWEARVAHVACAPPARVGPSAAARREAMCAHVLTCSCTMSMPIRLVDLYIIRVPSHTIVQVRYD